MEENKSFKMNRVGQYYLNLDFKFVLVLFMIASAFVNLLFYGQSHLLNQIMLILEMGFLTLAIIVSRLKIALKDLTLGIIAIVLGFINAIINKSGYGTIIAYYIFICFSIISKYFSISKKHRKFMIGIVALCLWIIIGLYSRQHYSWYYCVIPKWSQYNYNANVMAILIFAAGIYSISYLDYFRRGVINLLVKFAVIGVCLYLLYRTGARTSFVLFVFYVIFGVLMRMRYNKKNIKHSVIFLTVAGLLITLVYIYMYRYLSDFYIFGKNLYTGRQKIWMEAWELIRGNLIFGYSNKHLYCNYFVNAHNSYIALLGNLGLVPFLLFGYFMARVFSDKYILDHRMVTAFFMFMVVAMFETLYTEIDLMFMIFLLPYLAKKELKIDT